MDESRVRVGFPLCNRVFLAGGCELGVEVVDESEEIENRGELQYGLRSEAGRFPTSRVEREVGGNGRVEKVFHLSAVPTVTAGFIGFAFDIRE